MTSAGEQEPEPCYSPQKALTDALTDWLEEFQSTDQPGGRVTLTFIFNIFFKIMPKKSLFFFLFFQLT